MNQNEMKIKQALAEKELLDMWERSTIPPVPPFVRTAAANTTENPKKVAENTKEPPKPPAKKGLGGLLGQDIFKFLDLKSFELNSDRMLLLLMIVLLSGEDSDNILLFALAYIML